MLRTCKSTNHSENHRNSWLKNSKCSNNPCLTYFPDFFKVISLIRNPPLQIFVSLNTELRPYLATYEQYVTCPTRQDKIIDLCDGNIPRAFRSFALPPIRNSDHNTVHLVPAYRPRVKTERVVKKHMRVWSPECVSELQGCFDCKDWDVLIGVSESVNEATDVISSYINFCEDMLIPTKLMKIFPNNKP